MHNCKTAHPEKTHRRRNRYLKRTLDPIRVAPKPLTAVGYAEKAEATAGMKLEQVRGDYRDMKAPSTQSRPTRDTHRVELAPASAMKNPVAWLKRKFARKTG